MSCRDEGDVWPFKKVGDFYDLNRWNKTFWQRFQTFLSLTDERDIVVQIEIWATFDYYRTEWERNPFNPQNNNTYTAVETKLPKMVNTHPTATENNFFWSIPAENNQPIVLKYQRRFVDQVLTHTAKPVRSPYRRKSSATVDLPCSTACRSALICNN